MRQVTTYSASIKASVLAKVIAPNAPSVVELANEFNIPYPTIYAWKKMMLKKQNVKSGNTPQRPHDKSPEAKLKAVIDTMSMSEQEQGAYCRTHGIYSNHLEAWKKQMLDLNSKPFLYTTLTKQFLIHATKNFLLFLCKRNQTRYFKSSFFISDVHFI
jgi:hypothetical protein